MKSPSYEAQVMRTQKLRLRNVFIAIRPNFFNIENEHVTLKYYGSVELERLIDDAKRLRQMVPTTIRLDGFANWVRGGLHYEVALIESYENALFRNVTTPHVTIRKSNRPLSNATFDAIYSAPQEIDSLWLGKSHQGKMLWMPIENEPIMDTAVRSWEIFGGL